MSGSQRLAVGRGQGGQRTKVFLDQEPVARVEQGLKRNILAGLDGLHLGSSGVPGGWCCVVRRKLLFSNDLWRKAGHSVYRTQTTEIK